MTTTDLPQPGEVPQIDVDPAAFRHLADAQMNVELDTGDMVLNIGPQHPATHGTLRLVVRLDGERVVAADPIIGYITQGFGVTVHRASCVNALRSSPERQIEVEWNTASADTYPVKIQIISYDRMGLLADLVGNISKLGANILHASSDTKENKMVESRFTINVGDTEQLERILSAMRRDRRMRKLTTAQFRRKRR